MVKGRGETEEDGGKGWTILGGDGEHGKKEGMI